ncbi:hypothetical protein UlMin_010121 [Ulmus minor]
MEELHLLAKIYYRTAPQNIKQYADEFFREMDINKDGKVKLHEFLAFMKNGGYFQMYNPHFFDDLKTTEHDYIRFWEVMTLYYILVSRRPFCDGCGTFIKGTFFTCVTCFESDKKSFNICINCFDHGPYNHEHDRSQYLDNFLLLERSRAIAEYQRKAFQQEATNSQYSTGARYQQVPYNPNYLWASEQPMNSQPFAETSSQVVAYNPTNNWVHSLNLYIYMYIYICLNLFITSYKFI